MFYESRVKFESKSREQSLENKVKKSTLKLYRKGDEIHFIDLGVWQVNRGIAQLGRIQENGNKVIVGWLTANSTFENNFNNSSGMYSAIALSDVYLRYYSPQDIAKSPMLSRQLVAQFSDRLLKSEHLLAIVATRGAEERLKQLLLMFKHEMGISLVDGVRLQVRFTHKQLAQIIGLTRVTITRILRSFQSQDLIYFDNRRHIVIKDL